MNSAQPTALAEAVLYLMMNPHIAREIGRNARKSMEDFFTVYRQMAEYEALYEELSLYSNNK